MARGRLECNRGSLIQQLGKSRGEAIAYPWSDLAIDEFAPSRLDTCRTAIGPVHQGRCLCSMPADLQGQTISAYLAGVDWSFLGASGAFGVMQIICQHFPTEPVAYQWQAWRRGLVVKTLRPRPPFMRRTTFGPQRDLYTTPTLFWPLGRALPCVTSHVRTMSALALGLALIFAYLAMAAPLVYFVGGLLRRVRETSNLVIAAAEEWRTRPCRIPQGPLRPYRGL